MHFLSISTISVIAIMLACMVIYEVLRLSWIMLPQLRIAPRLRVLWMMFPIFGAHIVNVWMYAVFYFLVENFTTIGVITGQGHPVGFNYDGFVDCLYFSAATYTSLGFGDLLPTGHLRMLAGAEVLSGLMMIGWTASFTYLAMEKFWQMPHGKR